MHCQGASEQDDGYTKIGCRIDFTVIARNYCYFWNARLFTSFL